MYQIKNFDVDVFLSEYWQKKPLLIKQGFSHFQDPLDEHELAGLALEENIDSRVISLKSKKWQVAHGPFEDINQHCKGAWSLLVQAVDQHVPEADELMRAFSFIPHWRMTDLMVSFSNESAGVGPHIDQYDVFIVQGKGTRRWQIGLPGDYSNKVPHPELKQITEFEPIIDEALQPGDIIYIPPHHPHNGVALEYCMNYSVGFRAPSAQELLSSFSDFSLENNLFTQRYLDQKITPRKHPSSIKLQEIAQFKQMLHQAIDSPNCSQWLAEYLSTNNRANKDEEDPSEAYSMEEISELLADGQTFVREPGIKPIFIESQEAENSDFIFYIEGQAFHCPANTAEFVQNFLNSAVFNAENGLPQEICLFFRQTLTTLVNSGYWFPE
ncbi:cupin domain-containing protein [Paraglaciecola hydrolytica]|uniref:RmlC-like domain-containing protein n=1 Tax=Paraglaciecola hydrolytica TaxID=1799789 RepID=A0A136A3Y3_9ALTE|nr:cupin domain-containing protein [Paraglaciecola hydrolytica]KXI29916.1 RmlC-like domain-containing protein [Paraglaciecola hydrolytica]